MRLRWSVISLLLFFVLSAQSVAGSRDRYKLTYKRLSDLNSPIWGLLQLHQISRSRWHHEPEHLSTEEINALLTRIVQEVQRSLPTYPEPVITPTRKKILKAVTAVKEVKGRATEFASDFIGYMPPVDPEAIPVIWLFYPDIREHLIAQKVPIESPSFLARLRVFDGVEFPAGTVWDHLVISGFGFFAARFCDNRFSHCKISTSNLGRTLFRYCCFDGCILRDLTYNRDTRILSSEVIHSEDIESSRRFLKLARIRLKILDTPFENQSFTYSSWYWFTANIMVEGGASEALRRLDQTYIQEFPVQFIFGLDQACFLRLTTALLVNYVALLLHQASASELTQQYRSILALYFPSELSVIDERVESQGITPRLLLVDIRSNPALRTQTQREYDQALAEYLSSHRIYPVPVAGDNHCFYHALLHGLQQLNAFPPPEGVESQTDWMRQLIAGFIFVFLAWQDNPQEAEPELHTKIQQLNNMLNESFDLDSLLETFDDVTNNSTWAAQFSVPLIAVLFQHPVWLIHNHGPHVAAGITLPDGSSINETNPQWNSTAAASIPLIHNGINHWFTGIVSLLMPVQPLNSAAQ